MAKINILIIGAGGYRWGPMNIRDIMLNEDLAESVITLYDIDGEALSFVYCYAKIVEKHTKFGTSIKIANTLESALENQDFVILTIGVGGLDFMAKDLSIAAKYGIHHTVGDTIGPAGISRAIRHIPVVLSLANEMEKICPNAHLINTSNPLTLLNMALKKYSNVVVTGVCHEPHHVIHTLSQLFWTSNIEYSIEGLNHFSWFTTLKINQINFSELWQDIGKQSKKKKSRLMNNPLLHSHFLAPEMLSMLNKVSFLLEEFNSKPTDSNILLRTVLPILLNFQIFDQTGVFPAVRPRHFSEFFSEYLTEQTNYGKLLSIPSTSIQWRKIFREQLRQEILAVLEGKAVKPFAPSDREIIPIVCAIANKKNERHFLNIADGKFVIERDITINGFHRLEPISFEKIIHWEVFKKIEAINHNYHRIVNSIVQKDNRLLLEAFQADALTQNATNLKELFYEIKILNETFFSRCFNSARRPVLLTN